MPLVDTAYIVGVFFNLISVTGLEYNFQNFEPEDSFIWGNKEYLYCPITYNPPERNITADNSGTTLKLPLVPALIEILESNDYFSQAVIEPYIVLQDFPNVPPIAEDRMTVSTYEILDNSEDGGIALTIESPFNAINGQFPNIFYTTGFGALGTRLVGYIPEIPINSQVAIN